jgi:hypothetical protein
MPSVQPDWLNTLPGSVSEMTSTLSQDQFCRRTDAELILSVVLAGGGDGERSCGRPPAIYEVHLKSLNRLGVSREPLVSLAQNL